MKGTPPDETKGNGTPSGKVKSRKNTSGAREDRRSNRIVMLAWGSRFHNSISLTCGHETTIESRAAAPPEVGLHPWVGRLDDFFDRPCRHHFSIRQHPDAIADGEFFEMQTFSKALIDLVLGERVDRETAANAASNRHDFEIALVRAEKAAIVTAANAGEPKVVERPKDDGVPALRVAGA